MTPPPSLCNTFPLRQRVSFLPTLSLVFLTVFVLLSGSMFAQQLPERPPTEQLLPETTIAYAKVTSFSDLFEKFKTSLGAKMLEDESIAPLANQLYEYATDQYSRVQDDVGMSLDELRSLPSGEMTVALVAPRRKDMAVVVLMELDDENEAVDKALGRVREIVQSEDKIKDEPTKFEIKMEKALVNGTPVFFFRHAGVMIGSTSKNVLEGMLLRWSGGEHEKVRPLSQNRKFITISNRCSTSDEFPPDMKIYIDPIAIFKASAKGNTGLQVAVAVLPVFGLDGLLAIGGNLYSQTDGYESIMHGHMMLASPREGIFDAIALKPGQYQPQPWVPVNVGSYMTTSWDIQQMYVGIKEISNTLFEGSFDEFEEGLRDAPGIEFKKDLIDQFTGRTSMIRPILEGDHFNSIGNVLAVELKDPQAFDEFVERQLTREDAADLWSPVEHEGIRYWTMGDVWERQDEQRRKRRKKNGQPISNKRRRQIRDTMRPPTPSCVVLGDDLILGDCEEFVRMAIETSNGDRDALVDDADFQRQTKLMTKLLKSEVPAAMLFSDSARELDVMRRAIGSDQTMESIAKQAEENPEYFQGLKDLLEDNELPDYDLIRKYIPTTGGFVTSDDSGYHFLIFQESVVREK